LALVAELSPTRQELRAVDAQGNTCLFYAAAALNLDMVKYLIGLMVSGPTAHFPGSVLFFFFFASLCVFDDGRFWVGFRLARQPKVPEQEVSAADVNAGNLSPDFDLHAPAAAGTAPRPAGAPRRGSTMIAPGLVVHHQTAADRLPPPHRTTPAPPGRGGGGGSAGGGGGGGGDALLEVRSGFLMKRRETDYFRKRW
jgi:hypothetical protein